MEAAAVIVTIHDQAAIDEIVRVVRALRPDMLIVSRARDATHARHLYAIGVTDAVPETIEASLQLSEAALVGLGVPTGPVIASIHEKRDEFRHELQEAAGQAGRTTRAFDPREDQDAVKAGQARRDRGPQPRDAYERRHAIEPWLRLLQLRGKLQQRRLLAVAAGEMHAHRQAVRRPVQRHAHGRRAGRVVQRRHGEICVHALGERRRGSPFWSK